MKKIYLFFLILPYLICAYIITHQTGCHLIFPHHSSPCTNVYTYECTCDVVKYPSYYRAFVDENLLPDVIAYPDKPYLQGTDCNKAFRAKVDPLVHPNTSLQPADGLKIALPVYCGISPWVINRIVHDEEKGEPGLKGCGWVKTARQDWNNQSNPFMEITFKEEPLSLFIAYDARLKPVPGWLSKDYQPVAGSYIEIFNENTKGTIHLNIWQSSVTPKKGETFRIPGNLFSETGTPKLGPADPAGSEAMYMVIIRPHEEKNTQLKPTIILKNETFSSGCEYLDTKDKEAAKKEARKFWENKYKNKGYDFVNIVPTFSGDCLESVKKKCQSLSYPPHSEIKFSPPVSMADVNIPGKNKFYPKRPVEGKLQFEYRLDKLLMKQMHINSMHLELPNIWEFSGIQVDLMAPCTAEWAPAGTTPSQKIPCSKYKIKKRKFRACVKAKHDGNLVVIDATNRFEIPVTIDPQNRSFNIQGKMSGNIVVNGEDTTVEVEIDLTGVFYNFAPNASWEESSTFSGCEEKSNKDPIYLDASLSFDPDDLFGAQAQPGNIVHYHWYEDYGLITQKDWGQGKQVTIPAYKLSFGVHDFTLVVRDDKGVQNKDHFVVTVFDNVPPDLSIPQDYYRLLIPPEKGPVKVALGAASANDACACSDVLVTNDAPEDLMFGPGMHQVTWKADDGRGNVKTGIQDVHIWLAREMAIADLETVSGSFTKPFDGAGADIRAMKDKQDRKFDFTSQRHLIDRITRMVEGLCEGGEESAETARLVEICREADGILDQAEKLIDLSGGAEAGDRARLLDDASNLMAGEASLMREIHEILKRMNRE